jgi:hypothetical protein
MIAGMALLSLNLRIHWPVGLVYSIQIKSPGYDFTELVHMDIIRCVV